VGTVTTLARRTTLAARVALARALLSHRPWCPDCQAHADLVTRALNGEPIESLSRRGGAA